jgi:hypothetical protein
LTYGYVSDVCNTFGFVDGDAILAVCFARVNGTAQPGDSGAPVTSASVGGVTLYGFLSTISNNTFTYTTMSSVWWDLSLNPAVWLFCAC